MPELTWRQFSDATLEPIIEQAIAERWDEARLKTAMRREYPFGERAHYPYKAWLAAQRDALRRYQVALGIGPALDDLPLFATTDGAS